jgi:hypothetical protein
MRVCGNGLWRGGSRGKKRKGILRKGRSKNKDDECYRWLECGRE